jgi:hypothetical protein
MKDDVEAPLCFRNSASPLIVQTHHFLICETAMYVLTRQFRISGSGKKSQPDSSAIMEMSGRLMHDRSTISEHSRKFMHDISIIAEVRRSSCMTLP